jgi:hypothetical protein
MKIPTGLEYNKDEFKDNFKHCAAVVKNGKVIAKGKCSLAGCRYLNNNLGRSCHAEVNACKMLPYKIIVNPRKVAKVDHV